MPLPDTPTAPIKAVTCATGCPTDSGKLAHFFVLSDLCYNNQRRECRVVMYGYEAKADYLAGYAPLIVKDLMISMHNTATSDATFNFAEMAADLEIDAINCAAKSGQCICADAVIVDI